jgi:signal transduction histidine kinase
VVSILLLSFFFIIFSISFGAISQKEILPEINEQTIISFTLVFWYIYILYFHPSLSGFWTWLALIPSSGVLIICFINARLGFFWKLFFYTWFLLIIVFLSIFYFSFGNLSFFFNQENIKTLSPLDVFSTGMAFLYLVANIWYIFELIPISGKYQTIGDRIREWKEYTKLLTGKYSDYQLRPVHTGLIITFQGGILFLNYFLKFLPDDLITSISILLIPQLISSRLTTKKNLARK